MVDERIVRFRPRAILTVIGVVLAVAIVLEVIWVTRSVIIWVLIALFLAMALNPAVEFLVRRGIKRGPAVGIVFVGAILVIVGIAATFVPTLVREVNDLADAVPGYIDDLTRGRGRLGFLERDYHIVERARDAIEKSGAGGVLGLSNTALSLTKSILNAVIAVVTIAFLTLFMLLEGPTWVERIYGLHLGAVAAALAQGRRRHLSHGRWLRHRQPRDQPDRRRHVHRSAAHPRRSLRRRARPRRRHPRPDPAGRRHARRDHRQRRRLPPLDDRRASCW